MAAVVSPVAFMVVASEAFMAVALATAVVAVTDKNWNRLMKKKRP
jgi:hypothetical protein